MKYWLLLACPYLLSIGCSNGADEMIVLDESPRGIVTSLKNPTALERACKDHMLSTGDFVPSPIAEDVSKGYESGLCHSLMAGEDPNQKNNEGKSLLQIANEITDSTKRTKMVEILKAAGAK